MTRCFAPSDKAQRNMMHFFLGTERGEKICTVSLQLKSLVIAIVSLSSQAYGGFTERSKNVDTFLLQEFKEIIVHIFWPHSVRHICTRGVTFITFNLYHTTCKKNFTFIITFASVWEALFQMQ